jgi:surfactin synthase thioesterase subunit
LETYLSNPGLDIAASGADAWLAAPLPQYAAGQRLYCLPPAGRGAATYRKWPSLLPPELSVFRIQPPGRETRFREPCCADLNEYLWTLFELIERAPGEPFALFGHSLGALLAFELVHLLRERTGKEPEHLFVSAFRSPRAELPLLTRALPDARSLMELLQLYGAVDGGILQHPEIVELMLPAVTADLGLLASYHYRERPPLACPITVLGGRADRWVSLHDLWAWQPMTGGDFAVHVLPGGHFYIESALSMVIDIVRRSLLPACR